jgi:hypothetical protein
VDGDQVAAADELVQLDVVDVAALAELRGVQDDEDVVAVGAHLGHGVALDAGADGERVEVEHLRQNPGGLLVAGGDVHPHQPVVAGEQRRQVLDRMLLDAVVGHEANLHATPPPGSSDPLPQSGAAATAPAQQPSGAPTGLWWAQTRAASGLLGGDGVAPHQRSFV